MPIMSTRIAWYSLDNIAKSYLVDRYPFRYLYYVVTGDQSSFRSCDGQEKRNSSGLDRGLATF